MAKPKSAMVDDPKKITDDLVQEHGIDHAVKIVIENVSNAKSADDNYKLSIWREVRNLLRKLEA